MKRASRRLIAYYRVSTQKQGRQRAGPGGAGGGVAANALANVLERLPALLNERRRPTVPGRIAGRAESNDRQTRARSGRGGPGKTRPVVRPSPTVSPGSEVPGPRVVRGPRRDVPGDESDHRGLAILARLHRMNGEAQRSRGGEVE